MSLVRILSLITLVSAIVTLVLRVIIVRLNAKYGLPLIGSDHERSWVLTQFLTSGALIAECIIVLLGFA